MATCVTSGTFGQSMVKPLPAAQISLKSAKPGVLLEACPRSAKDGTEVRKTCPGTKSRRHSWEKKKNVFSLLVLYGPGIKTGRRWGNRNPVFLHWGRIPG